MKLKMKRTKMIRKYVFRIHGPAETVVVPVQCDPHLLPSKVEEAARNHALKTYIKKHNMPTVELVSMEEDSPIITVN